MAFVPNSTMQNQAFAVIQFGVAIAPTLQAPTLLTCTDNQGNTIKKTILEVDASGGQIDIMLPSIASLSNDLNCEIDVVIIEGTGAINILSNIDLGTGVPSGDTIGQTANLNIAGATYTIGAVLTFKPAYEGFWSYSVTEN